MSDEEIIKFWEDALVLVPLSDLQIFNLPESTVKFLSSVGLPLKSNSLRERVKQGMWLEFVKDTSDIRLEKFDSANYVIIGKLIDVEGIVTGIRQSDGSIYNLYFPPTSEPTRLLNTSLKHYLAYIQLFLIYHPVPFMYEDTEVIERMTNLIKALREVDPVPLTDPESYWYCMILDFLGQASFEGDIENLF